MDIGVFCTSSTHILCRKVTFVYIRCRFMSSPGIFSCIGIMDKLRLLFARNFHPSTTGFFLETIDFPKKIC